jgi:hypothetical protein
MNKLFYAFTVSLILIFFTGDLLAQTFKLTGEVRPRYEYRHGFKTLFPDDATAANFISQRTRLNGFFANETFKVYLSLQDVRVWGDVKQLNTTDYNGLSVHEAWAQVKLAKILHLKVGRQEIIYDDQRIFGSVGWAQQARSHDAAIFKFFFGDRNKMDFGFAYNALGESLYKIEYKNINNYKTIQWLHYHGDYGEHHGLSLLFLNNGIAYDSNSDSEVTDEKVAFSQTSGARYTLKFKVVKFNVAIYNQIGNSPKGSYNDNYIKELQAMYFSANVTIQPLDFFNVGVGFEYLSGTSTVDQKDKNATNKSFTPFYGTNHKFNGWMDYFYVGNYNGQNGLLDIYLPVKFKVEKWNFGLIPHYMAAAATVSTLNDDNQSTTDYSNYLGTEIDVVVGYTLSKSVNIQGGYSHMFATQTMQVIKYPDNPNGEFYKNKNQWAWIMFTFKPTFFDSDKKKK